MNEEVWCSGVKNTADLAGPRFGFQHLHDNSHPPLVPVSGYPMPYFGFHRHCIHLHTCSKTHTHKIKIFKEKKVSKNTGIG